TLFPYTTLFRSEAGHGAIVNISSAAGVFKAAPNRYVYGATKAAVAALTRAVAVDFITRGIRCNCICPGTIETPSMLNRAAAAGRFSIDGVSMVPGQIQLQRMALVMRSE